MIRLNNWIVSLLICLFAWPANAYEISCERSSNSWNGFVSRESMESVYPKTVQLNAKEFSTKFNSTSVFYHETILGTKVSATLLKNGTLVVTLLEYASYVDGARYKCDANAIEVAAFIKSGKKPKTQPIKTNEFQAAWSCGKTLDDVSLSLDKNGTLTREEDDEDVEIYGLVGGNRLALVKTSVEDESQGYLKLINFIMENIEWTKRGDTYVGNGIVTLAEYMMAAGDMFGVTMTLNDERLVGSMVSLSDNDFVSAMGISKCERLY